jgi:hypothetical protein
VVESILCAAVVASPLDPGLTFEEVKNVALAHGVGVGAFDAAVSRMYEIGHDANKRLLADSKFWGEMTLAGFVTVPRNIRPGATLDALAGVFDELENQMGPREPIELVAHTYRAWPPRKSPLLLVSSSLGTSLLVKGAASFVSATGPNTTSRPTSTASRPEEPRTS